MSLTKHIIFKVEIKGNINIEKVALKQLDEFVEDPNHVYINHSISILTEDKERYGSVVGENKFLIISLIYKDLNSTPLDLKNTGKKIKSIISNEVKNEIQIKEPDIVTDFDKEFKKTTEKVEKDRSEF